MHNSNFTTLILLLNFTSLMVKGHHFFHQRKGAPVKAPSQPYLSVCVLMGCGPKCWSHKKKEAGTDGEGRREQGSKLLNTLWQGDTRKVLKKSTTSVGSLKALYLHEWLKGEYRVLEKKQKHGKGDGIL